MILGSMGVYGVIGSSDPEFPKSQAPFLELEEGLYSILRSILGPLVYEGFYMSSPFPTDIILSLEQD